MASEARLDVDQALDELQNLIAAVGSDDSSGIEAEQIAQRLRSLENELRASSVATTAASPSPRRDGAPVSVAARVVLAPEPSLQTIRQSISMRPREPSVVDIGQPTKPTDESTISRYRAAHSPASTASLVRHARNGLNVSFSTQLASDDHQRLRFIVDAVSNQLHKERAWRKELECSVVPPLLARIETLERERESHLDQLRSMDHELSALKLQAALHQVAPIPERMDSVLQRIHQLCDALSTR